MKTTLKSFETYGGQNLYAVALAVKSQTGLNKEDFFSELENVLQSPYGAAAGFTGFIYYSETVNFWRKNKAKILRFAEDQADEIGQNVVDMVAGFKAIKDDFTAGEIAAALYGRYNEDYINIYNVLAWYCLEEIAFYYDIFKNN